MQHLQVVSRASQFHMSQKFALSPAVAASALQDHLCRRFKLPSSSHVTPGSSEELTLAQRLRLVEAPVRLSPAQWLAVHAAALQRGCDCCAVCLAPLVTQPTVLLSCSHELHVACQAAVERFANQRACPLCRCATYDKARVAQLDATLAAGPRPLQVELARRWCAARLGVQSDRLVRQVEASSCELDLLFAELEATVAAARAVGAHLLPGSRDAPVPAAAPAAAAPPAAQAERQEARWHDIINSWLRRDDAPECPVCLGRLAAPEAGASDSCSGGGSSIAVLSCSHAFHASCMDCVEAFALASSLPAACPCCRSRDYTRMDIGSTPGT